MKDHFTIRMGFEVMRFLQTLSESAVVVDLAVDRKDECGIIVNDRLRTRICTPVTMY
jgi:hypothetical protein